MNSLIYIMIGQLVTLVEFILTFVTLLKRGNHPANYFHGRRVIM